MRMICSGDPLGIPYHFGAREIEYDEPIETEKSTPLSFVDGAFRGSRLNAPVMNKERCVRLRP